jgi:hypothetical protein
MQYLCQNGEDYDECDEIVEVKNSVCNSCAEKAYDLYLEDFYGESSPVTQKERYEDTMKKLHGIK